MANSEYGSWLGVITAATVTMITIAGLRHFRSLADDTTPASSRNTSTIGNSKATPKATIISRMRLRYFDGVKNVERLLPPTPTRNLSAGLKVTIATTPPSRKSTIDDRTNGIA